jgi:LuxR family maltose regulon positive regulatory protein
MAERLSGQLILRADLLARLDRARFRRVLAIEAPAGYGKSELLASWVCQLGQQGIATISLPPSESAQVLTNLIIAIRSLISGTSPESTAANISTPAFAAKYLLAMLQDFTDQLVIVVDDYDRASSDELDELLSDLLRGTPTNIHWVFSSRTQIRIPLGRLWSEANVFQLGQNELRFSEEEIRNVFDRQLSDADQKRISEWTEGWPLAIQLIRHYLVDRQEVQSSLNELLERAHGDLAKYLTDQVLDRLPERSRELLIRSSFLNELRADLLERVIGISPSWLILQELRESNVFVIPVDEAESRYHCHSILREILFEQLRRRGPDALAELNLAAAKWFHEKGELQQALHHASAAGSYDFAAEMIQDAGGIFYGVRHGAPALRMLMDYVPSETVSRYPRLILAQVLLLVKEARLDVAQDLLDIVGRGRSLPGAAGEEPLLTRDLAMADLMLGSYAGVSTNPASLEILDRWFETAPPDAFWLHAIRHNLLCDARYMASDFPGALAAADSAQYYYALARSSHGAAHIHLYVGRVHLELADPVAALQAFQQARVAFESGPCPDQAGCNLAAVLTAAALYDQGRLADSRRICPEAMAAMESGECQLNTLVSGYQTLSALAVADEGTQAALRVVAHGLAVASLRGFADIEHYLLLRKAELEMDSGQASSPGREVAILRGPRLDSQSVDRQLPWRESDLEVLLGARIAFQSGKKPESIAALERQEQALAATGRVRSRVVALIHLAICHDEIDEPAEATRYIRTAIGLSIRGGLIAPFIEKGRPVMAVLANLLMLVGPNTPDAAERDFAKRALRLGIGPDTPLVSALSYREREILRLLQNGQSNKLIARVLDISPDTVRFHLKGVYEKFGVSDRRVVATMARECGLID